MSDQLGDDGFVKVERFKYKPVNNSKKKNKRNNKHTFKDSDDWTMEDMASTLKQRKWVSMKFFFKQKKKNVFRSDCIFREALIDSRFYKDLSGKNSSN